MSDSQNKKIWVSFVVDGKISSITYSEAEAIKAGLYEAGAYSLVEDTVVKLRPLGNTRTCPNCGFSQHDFHRTGRLGCATCHETFKDLLAPLLRRMHKDTSHAGKVPQASMNDEIIHNRLTHLRKEISHAVNSERYEDAADIRDKISELEDKLQ